MDRQTPALKLVTELLFPLGFRTHWDSALRRLALRGWRRRSKTPTSAEAAGVGGQLPDRERGDQPAHAATDVVMNSYSYSKMPNGLHIHQHLDEFIEKLIDQII